MQQHLDNLKNCSFDKSSFEDILENLQKLVDDLNICGYKNLSVWVLLLFYLNFIFEE